MDNPNTLTTLGKQHTEQRQTDKKNQNETQQTDKQKSKRNTTNGQTKIKAKHNTEKNEQIGSDQTPRVTPSE